MSYAKLSPGDSQSDRTTEKRWFGITLRMADHGGPVTECQQGGSCENQVNVHRPFGSMLSFLSTFHSIEWTHCVRISYL